MTVSVVVVNFDVSLIMKDKIKKEDIILSEEKYLKYMVSSTNSNSRRSFPFVAILLLGCCCRRRRDVYLL
jgi:hypothetical protein